MNREKLTKPSAFGMAVEKGLREAAQEAVARAEMRGLKAPGLPPLIAPTKQERKLRASNDEPEVVRQTTQHKILRAARHSKV